jgi:hypothetical protein
MALARSPCVAVLLVVTLVSVLVHAAATARRLAGESTADQVLTATAEAEDQNPGSAGLLGDITDSPYYYLILLPLLVPTTSIFGYLNWMSLQFFRTG